MRFAGALLLVVLGCAPQSNTSAGPALAITHVTVVDVRAGTTIPDQTVVIRGNRITRVAGAAMMTVADSITLVDGRGKFLIPGLWDMHVHLDSADLGALLRFGVTGARDMGGDLEQLLTWRRRIAAGELTGPRLVVAGPMLRGPRGQGDTGAWVIRTDEQGIRAVDSLFRRNVDFIKVHEGLVQSVYVDIARRALTRKLPFAGHVPAGVGVWQVTDLHQNSIEHLEFVPDACMGWFADKTRGAADFTPEACTEREFTILLGLFTKNRTWLDPTIGSFRIFAPRQFPAIHAGFKDLVPLLRRHNIRLLAGTDLGTPGIMPGASLHDELVLLVDAGYTPVDVLRAATLNPAEFLGLTDSLGTVEAGKVADLVLLEANPLTDITNTRRIATVIRAGRVVQH